MPNAAQTYKNVARQTSSPRELEATLLLQAAARLQSVHDAWDSNCDKLGDALLYNRKLCSVFMSEMTDTANPMPKNIRQNVANIGLFVMNHTVKVLNDPRPHHLGSLISINREIAARLLGRALPASERAPIKNPRSRGAFRL